MIGDIKDLLPLYALGVLEPDEPDEAGIVERAVASDPVLAGELASFQRAAEACIAPIAPPSHVKSRLLASIGGGRFECYAPRMASLFDVSVERARELLALVERPASWEVPMPGVELIHFDGGPTCATADCGFVRLPPGGMFPPHVHIGEETSFILTGHLRDGDRLLGPGDELVEHARGPEHVVRTEGDDPVIYVARAEGGIEIDGVRAK